MNTLGIKKDTAKTLAEKLNQLLANYHIYYQNLRSYHWNVKGEHFFVLHPKFEEFYNEAKTNIDDIAERILTLRHSPTSMMREYVDMAQIKEKNLHDTEQMVLTLLENQSILIENMREVIEAANNIEDEGTIDLVAGLLSSLEKKSWMLDTWLNRS